MPNYRRLFVPGGTYFFTVNLRDRKSGILIDRIDDLRASWCEMEKRHPFETIAAVVLHDHMHFLWSLPPGDDDFPTRIRLLKAGFTRRLPEDEKSKGRKGERNIWQRRYWEHCIKDDEDLARHIDYVHWNPVKHGYVDDPDDWSYSPFREWKKEFGRPISMPPENWKPAHLGEADGGCPPAVAGASPVYDGNGNLTTDHNGRGFIYDAENVLRSASGLASGTASYRYHADGSRREKTALGAVTQFYYMGGLGYLDEEDTQFAADQEIAEYAGATLLRRYIRLPGSVDETFLMIDMTLDPSCTNTSYATCERWAQTDRLGSVVASMDSAGAVLDKYRYSPYGVPGWEGELGFPFRFTGQKLDPETGLYYYKARYYDPEVGRFLQTDPIGYEDQMNLYAYVGNDPVNGTDPTGLCRASRIETCQDQDDPSGKLVRATEDVVKDGKTNRRLNDGEKKSVNESVKAIGEAKQMGENGDVDGFIEKVETRGDWDLKNRKDLIKAGASFKSLERLGNWLFGATGAAWEHGRFGALSAVSDFFGTGEDMLRRGAGAYQQFRQGPFDIKNGLPTDSMIFNNPIPCPVCSYGDRPGDGKMISRGYDFYRKYRRRF